MVVCAGIMAVGAATKFMPAFWAGAWMMVFQIYNGTFGSDGRRYRRAKQVVEATSRIVEVPSQPSAVFV
jgi:hypothetical protein